VTELRALVAVAVGAACGGVMRLLITQWAVARLGPGTGHIPTLFINVTGSFLIGVVLEITIARDLDPVWRLFLATGVLGGYTTFSTYSYETITLWNSGATVTMLLYTGGSVIFGVLACVGGIALARAFAH
jgi:CrcB protein